MNLNFEMSWSLNDIVYYVVFNASRAAFALLQFDSYLYWPFLLSTIALAVMVAFRDSVSGGGVDWGHWRKKLRSFLSKDLWWHPSARADYKLYFCNALLHPITLVPILLNSSAVADWLRYVLGGVDSSSAMDAGAREIARFVFTFFFFVAYDYGRFIAHWMLHDISILWPFHKVHHSAEVLTPITSFRLHPVDLLVMAWVPTLLTGAVTWFFNTLFGGGIDVFTYLGLHVFIWVFNLVDNLRHSPVWLSYGNTVGKWLVSPAHHQLHHSMERMHWGCNLGSNLAIWDRLHGSLYVPGDRPEKFRMGLGDGSESHWHGLWTIYFRPFRESFQCAMSLVRNKRGQL